jgi:hypothetical protein
VVVGAMVDTDGASVSIGESTPVRNLSKTRRWLHLRSLHCVE